MNIRNIVVSDASEAGFEALKAQLFNHPQNLTASFFSLVCATCHTWNFSDVEEFRACKIGLELRIAAEGDAFESESFN